MKHYLIYVLIVLTAALPAALPAAVPLRWTVETSRLQPVAFDAVRGETLALEASFNSYGTPLSMAGKHCALYYQTNGMGSAWWTAPATAVSNRITATITPQMVPSSSPATAPGSTTATAPGSTTATAPGSTTATAPSWQPATSSGQPATAPVAIQAFLGSTGDIYRAACTIRFRNGPGATPNVIDYPPAILDLAHTVVINQPWPTTNDFQSATNDMQTALKAYVDEQIEGAGTVSPQIVTNIVDGKIAEKRDKTDMFTDWTATGSAAIGHTVTVEEYYSTDVENPYSYALIIDGVSVGGGCGSTTPRLSIDWSDPVLSDPTFDVVTTRQRILTTADSSSFATTNDITSTVTKSYVESLGILSPSNETFSTAVLNVGIGIDTNSVAVLNEIASDFGGFPIGGTVTTVGGILAALAAAVAWLKKNRVGKITCNGSTDIPAENGKADVSALFTSGNTSLMGVVRYQINAAGTILDRNINVVSSGAFVIPSGFTDLLIRFTGTPVSLTFADSGITDYGDDLPSESGDYLITVTKIDTDEAYIRVVTLEERT